MRYEVTVEGKTFEIVVDRDGRVWINDRLCDVDFCGVDGLSQYSLLIDHRSHEAHVELLADGECYMVVNGRSYRTRLHKGWQGDGQRPSPSCPPSVGEVCAPLPGLLVAVPVDVGQRVTEGQVVAVLESMKMNLELRASSSGVVQAIHAEPGTEVGQGEVVVLVKPDE